MIRRNRGPVRGVLVFLAGLMLASGLIRVGLGLTQAQAVPAPDTPMHAQPAAGCAQPVKELAYALGLRESRLSVQESAINQRMAALALVEEALAARLRQVEAAEASLSATLAAADGAAEGDLTRLTSVYEAMKPKDAAALFGAMAPEFAAGFLGRMQPEAAAAVLSGMSAEGAYAISVLLAGRNARVPTE